MKDEKSSNMKTLGLAAATLAIIVSVGFGVYKLLGEDEPKSSPIAADKISGFGSTPEEATAAFIMAAGNMGNKDDVNFEKLDNRSAVDTNLDRRMDSYQKSSEGIVTGSPLLIENQQSYIDAYSITRPWAEYYEVKSDSIRIGKATPTDKVTIDRGNEVVEYEASKVNADFVSTKYHYQATSNDVDADGSFTEIFNKQLFEEVEFTLVKVDDDAWRIYQIDKIVDIGDRFSIWDTQGPSMINHENDTEGRILR